MISFFATIAIRLALGLLFLVFVINVTGKGNLAPNSAVDQVQNFVLGGIIGGVIYNSSITIIQYIVILIMWTILILLLKLYQKLTKCQGVVFSNSESSSSIHLRNRCTAGEVGLCLGKASPSETNRGGFRGNWTTSPFQSCAIIA